MTAAEPFSAGAARARRQATVVAAVGAAVPTILAAQGMTYLAVDGVACEKVNYPTLRFCLAP